MFFQDTKQIIKIIFCIYKRRKVGVISLESQKKFMKRVIGKSFYIVVQYQLFLIVYQV